MRFRLLIFIFLVSSFSWAQQDPYRTLSPQDYETYIKTFHKCRTGTVGAAFLAGLDPGIIQSAAVNLSQLMMLSLKASKERMDSKLMSPELYRLRHSAGYWLAFTHCYGDSSYGRQVLIKGIVDLGQLTAESSGSLASIWLAAQVAAANMQLMEAYPVITRLFISVGMSMKLSSLFNVLKREHFGKPTPEEAQLIQKIEANIFDKTDETLKQIIQLSEMKAQSLEAQLQDPNLSELQKAEIFKKREHLKKKIEELRTSMATK